MRWLKLLTGVAACGCLVAAIWLYVAPQSIPSPQPILVEPTHFTFVNIPAGEHELVIRLTNPSGVARRVVGFQDGCGTNCCFRSKHREQVVIGPGESLNYRIEFLVRNTGAFEGGTSLFLDEGQVRTVLIEMRGECGGQVDGHQP
jgi:hypothetical protein